MYNLEPIRTGDYMIVGHSIESITNTIANKCELVLQCIGHLDGLYYGKNKVGSVSAWPNALKTTPPAVNPLIFIKIQIDNKDVKITNYSFQGTKTFLQIEANWSDFPQLQTILWKNLKY